jgi:ssDNA-binding Zn-finger/Zn-ribbon topoisomerase 1
MNDWTRWNSVECVECPDCAFTFDADHEATDGSGYSCPVCAEVALTARVAQLEACLTDVCHQIELGGVTE